MREEHMKHLFHNTCRRGEAVDRAARGQYSAHVLGARAVQIVQDHAAFKSGAPLFLYLAFQSVHSPLQGEKMRLRYKKTKRAIWVGSGAKPPTL